MSGYQGIPARNLRQSVHVYQSGVRVLKLLALCACTLISLSAQDKAQDRTIDVQNSSITIHVGKAGLFSAAAHEHWVNAPISSGKYNESETPRIEFTVSAAKMEVKPDPKVDAKTQAEIQKDMQTMTLDSAKYPEIGFRSTRIVKSAQGQWKVEGALSLHGVTKTVRADVKKIGDSYTGRTTIKQTDFGIKPVTVGGGLVKVKDELDIEFKIR